MLLGIDFQREVEMLAGVVVARGAQVAPTPRALSDQIDAAIEGLKPDEATKAAVRDMLRHGRYKPTGRGKPASEYLRSAAEKDRFPKINNLVDINNLISLSTQLPISLVDFGRASATAFSLRRGRAGESFVFNQAGQVIELQDLLLVAKLPEDLPCANPVKDSMATKLSDDSTDVMAIIYAPPALLATLNEATEIFARMLNTFGGAEVAHRVLA